MAVSGAGLGGVVRGFGVGFWKVSFDYKRRRCDSPPLPPGTDFLIAILKKFDTSHNLLTFGLGLGPSRWDLPPEAGPRGIGFRLK